MWQKIILQSKKNLPDRGFLTLEIIVATLVAFFFLMFSLQAVTLSMFMKVQAQEGQKADQLIQEDIERFGNLSNTLTLDLDTKLADDAQDTNCDVVDYNDSYAFALWDAFDDPDTAVTTPLLTDGTGNAELSLSRTHVSENDSTGPYRTLKVFYQVTNNDGDIIANRYLEMIPDEALRCP